MYMYMYTLRLEYFIGAVNGMRAMIMCIHVRVYTLIPLNL